MPFKESSIVLQREEFCRLAQAPGANVRELCRRWEISPQTGYKWLGRFRGEGRAGLEDRSRRPLRSPTETPAEMEERVLGVRRSYPAWGGRKIRRVLQREGVAGIPSGWRINACELIAALSCKRATTCIMVCAPYRST